MALEAYKRKRDFKKTPEPPAEKVFSAKGSAYLIQKNTMPRASITISVWNSMAFY
jgi:hypothetical protein